jgi:hypothetical protein
MGHGAKGMGFKLKRRKFPFFGAEHLPLTCENYLITG